MPEAPMTDEGTENGSAETRPEEDLLDPETRRVFEASLERNKKLLERLAEL